VNLIKVVVGEIDCQKYGRISQDQLTITFDRRRITHLSGSATRLISDIEASFARSLGLLEINEFQNRAE